MTGYTLSWSETANDQLIENWLASSDPNAVTVASAMVEQRLMQDPIRFGRVLREGLWLIRYSPLFVYFTVDPVAQTVTVTDVFI